MIMRKLPSIGETWVSQRDCGCGDRDCKVIKRAIVTDMRADKSYDPMVTYTESFTGLSKCVSIYTFMVQFDPPS